MWILVIILLAPPVGIHPVKVLRSDFTSMAECMRVRDAVREGMLEPPEGEPRRDLSAKPDYRIECLTRIVWKVPLPHL